MSELWRLYPLPMDEISRPSSSLAEIPFWIVVTDLNLGKLVGIVEGRYSSTALSPGRKTIARQYQI